MNFTSRILCSLEARLAPPRLHIIRTLYINFRLLPFKQAIKLPFFIYGKIRFPMLGGSVIFKDTIVKTGMIKIGQADPFLNKSSESFISISQRGKIIIKGPTHIGAGVKLRIFAGELILGKYSYLGTDITLICNGEHIQIGDYSRIAVGTILINSSFHSVVNLQTMATCRNTKKIELGAYCWIGNRSNISAGTKLKDWTIVGANSLVNKDFSDSEGEHQMMAGNPAKIIKTGIQRIFSPKLEFDIIRYFNENPNENIYVIPNIDNYSITDLEKEF